MGNGMQYAIQWRLDDEQNGLMFIEEMRMFRRWCRRAAHRQWICEKNKCKDAQITIRYDLFVLINVFVSVYSLYSLLCSLFCILLLFVYLHRNVCGFALSEWSRQLRRTHPCSIKAFAFIFICSSLSILCLYSDP